MRFFTMQTGMNLFDQAGRRLYFTEDERRAFLDAAAKAPRQVRSFGSVLHYTGCRISEALALTQQSVDLSGKVIVFESLKKTEAIALTVFSCLPPTNTDLTPRSIARCRFPVVRH